MGWMTKSQLQALMGWFKVYTAVQIRKAMTQGYVVLAADSEEKAEQEALRQLREAFGIMKGDDL
jgi:hypothetical protein